MISRRRRLGEALVVLAALALVDVAVQIDRGWFELHLADGFCATRPTHLVALTMARVTLVAIAVVMVAWLRPRVGCWAARKTVTEAASSIARMLAAAVLALVVCDLGLRLKAHWHPPPPVPPAPLPPLVPDSTLGWKSAAPSTTVMMVDGKKITYAIDPDGMRAEAETDRVDWNVPSIVFGGESYTEGIGVDWRDAYPEVIERDTGIQAVPIAVHGYANDQIYLATKAALARVAKPVAVITLVLPTLLSRDLVQTRPRLVLASDGSFETAAAAPQWWLDSPVRKIAKRVFPYHDASPIQLARAIFAETKRMSEARGAFPLFVYTTWGDWCMAPSDGVPALPQRLFEGQDLHWIEVPLNPNEVDHTTYHPTPKAQRQLADAIEKALTHVLASRRSPLQATPEPPALDPTSVHGSDRSQ
ncbi:MAG: hypothetical protein ABI551_16720 [Polyangiaceae bacterium]